MYSQHDRDAAHVSAQSHSRHSTTATKDRSTVWEGHWGGSLAAEPFRPTPDPTQAGNSNFSKRSDPRRPSLFTSQTFTQRGQANTRLGTSQVDRDDAAIGIDPKPWNSKSSRTTNLGDTATQEFPLNGLGYSTGLSPTESKTFNSRNGGERLWSDNWPSFSAEGNGYTRGAKQQETGGSTHTRPMGNDPKLLSVSSSGRGSASLPTPTSSNGTRSSMRVDQTSPTDIERSFQQFSFPAAINQRRPTNRADADHASQQIGSLRLSRNGSSPGQTSANSNLGWNGASASQWAPNTASRPSLSGERTMNHASQPLDQDLSFAPFHEIQHGSHSMALGAFEGRRAHVNHAYTDRSLPAINAEQHMLSSYSFPRHTFQDVHGFDRNDAYENDNRHRQLNKLIPFRQQSYAARDLYVQDQCLNFHPGMGHDMHYFNPRYGPSWPNNHLALVSQPNLPMQVQPDYAQVVRSALLEEFRVSNKSGRRWELKVSSQSPTHNSEERFTKMQDIYGHIVEFAGDQHGSRFLQDKLKTANSEEKEHVFQEILPNSVQLMKDVFGNYVLQKFFEHGDQIQKAGLVSKMKGHVFTLSTQTYACRVVQKALGHILLGQQVDLMQELDGKVMDCIKCENGNHVVQVAIEHVPLEHIPFMIDAIQHDVQYLSMHKYGCRVIQRMLEHAQNDVLTWLVPELHKCSSMLIADQFGNYVPAHIVEKGSPEDRNKVIDVVRSNLLQFSKQKFASHVVEKCIRFGNDYQRRDFMHQFCGMDVSDLEHLIRDGFANYVVQSLLETLKSPEYGHFCQVLDPALSRARLPHPNKQAENVARRMHRYDRGLMFPGQHAYTAGPTWNNSVFVQ